MKTRKAATASREKTADSNPDTGSLSAKPLSGMCFICNKRPVIPETACVSCCKPLRKLFQDTKDPLNKAFITAIWH